MRKTRNITILIVAITLLLVSQLAHTPSVEGLEDVRFQSQYGNPDIDGTISSGEWGEWTEIALDLDSGPGPEPTMEVSIAVMNTGYHLYLGVQVPNQLPANQSTITEPPWLWYNLDIGIEDGVNKSLMGAPGRWRQVYYAIYVGTDLRPPDVASVWSGGAPMAETDPTRPRSAHSFTPTDGVRGTYTFEIVYPLTTTMPIRTLTGDVLFAGLHPVPEYKLFRLDWWGMVTLPGYVAYSYTYQLFYDTSKYYIVSAFDAAPLIVLGAVILVVISVLAILVIVCRRRRRRS